MAHSMSAPGSGFASDMTAGMSTRKTGSGAKNITNRPAEKAFGDGLEERATSLRFFSRALKSDQAWCGLVALYFDAPRWISARLRHAMESDLENTKQARSGLS